MNGMNTNMNMNPPGLCPTLVTCSFSSQYPIVLVRRNLPSSIHADRSHTQSMETATSKIVKLKHKPLGILDNMFFTLFRSKMAEEVGWDSDDPDYDGLIQVANRLMMKNRNNAKTAEAAVRILRSLFPPLLLQLFQMLVAPLGKGKVAAVMVARVTAFSCQWLMGPCKVNAIEFPDGSSSETGVFVERCKYLEESKCIGICVNTCKLPTQTFFKDYMGVPLVMEPNFSDYSCQFKFGVVPGKEDDKAVLSEPCLEICPNATRRRTSMQCPKV